MTTTTGEFRTERDSMGEMAVERAVAWSTKQGVVHAAAAGNSAKDLANKTTDSASPNDTKPITRQINNDCLDIPTELPGVVTVSSTTQPTVPAGLAESRFLRVVAADAPDLRSFDTLFSSGLIAGGSLKIFYDALLYRAFRKLNEMKPNITGFVTGPGNLYWNIKKN
mgnify:CR=1 FL=1